MKKQELINLLNNTDDKKLKDITEKLNALKERNIKEPTKKYSDSELYNVMIADSFNRIANSKELSIQFLKEVGILGEDGHLTDEYKQKQL